MTRGVAFLDHTADVGIDVEAPDLAGLLHRAALGMTALLRGEEEDGAPSGGGAEREPRAPDAAEPGGTAESAGAERPPESVTLAADGPAGLLAAWLRELLFLHDARDVDYLGAEFLSVTDTALRARVRTEPTRGAVREIKGVTYHELSARRVGPRWEARVIFDV